MACSIGETMQPECGKEESYVLRVSTAFTLFSNVLQPSSQRPV